MRFVLPAALVAVAVLATVHPGFTAPSGVAVGAVSGFAVSAVSYSLDEKLPTRVSAVSFTLRPLAARQQNGNGVAWALKQQWASVQAQLAAGHYVTALNNIEAFVSHLAAQSGKKVTVATSAELRLLAADVYLPTICQAVAAGQLNAAQHASRYAYYASLVTSLGGTPKPDC